jgi:hypothetical protein
MKNTIFHNNSALVIRKFVLLPDRDSDKLYDRIKREFYPNNEVVAYTTNGDALTGEQYRKRVLAGIEQCEKGESISLEKLCTELGYDYAEI